MSCENSNEKDSYEIYNAVLKEKVSTYGIMVNYFPYDRDYSEKEREEFIEKTKDSLIKSKSLTYFLSENLTIIDTLKPNHQSYSGKNNDLVIKYIPKVSKNKLDFSRIKELKIGKRINKEKLIDENQKHPTYLGSYYLSEPTIISKDKAVIRFQQYCGLNCGVEFLIYLKKENEVWKIYNEKMIWIY